MSETLVATVLIHTAISTSHKAGCYDRCGYTHIQITLWQLPHNYMVAQPFNNL